MAPGLAASDQKNRGLRWANHVNGLWMGELSRYYLVLVREVCNDTIFEY